MKRLTNKLYFWVLLAILAGGTLGYFDAETAVALKPLGDGFIALGEGFNVDPKTLDAAAVTGYAKSASEQSVAAMILHIIPKTFTDAFTGSGDLLQVLLVAILFGYAIMRLGKAGQQVHRFIEECSHTFFALMNIIMKAAPGGAGGAMAFTIGNYGIA